MENEIEKIFKEQLSKLPKEVVTFLSTANWGVILDEIGSLYNLSKEGLSGFKRETILVLVGLIHPDDFNEELEKEVGVHGAVLNALVVTTEQKIFSSIRPALIKFFEDGEASEQKGFLEAKSIAPANLPTEAAESFLPPLTPKVMPPKAAEPETILMHPFEEKLQRTPVSASAPASTPMPATFTPAAPTVPSAPQGAIVFTPAPNVSSGGSLTHDPYREPVE